MLIHEVKKSTNLTKKAIEYYTEQGLVNPVILNNGYRDFSKDDIQLLKSIALYRKLGLTMDEIKSVLADENGQALKKLSVQKELNLQREKAKKEILDSLSCGKDLKDLEEKLKALDQSETVTNKILAAFPGYYGSFISLHFSKYLNEPITTPEQLAAYEEIINFLDNVPALELPAELIVFFTENTKHISTENILEMDNQTKQAMENPEKFLIENKQVLADYLEFMNSEDYKNSPAYKMLKLLKDFNCQSGYNDVFIPAMKKLSSSYADYSKQMEAANSIFMEHYPEMVQKK